MIEQVLMKNLKTSGGLTRGRGMSEQQRIVWLLSMAACAEVNRAMQDITGIHYATGEQNKDITMARQKRDMKDTRTLPGTLTDRSPFDQSIVLRNIIMTGAHAGTAVNVDDAKHMGIVWCLPWIINLLRNTLSSAKTKLRHLLINLQWKWEWVSASWPTTLVPTISSGCEVNCQYWRCIFAWIVQPPTCIIWWCSDDETITEISIGRHHV